MLALLPLISLVVFAVALRRHGLGWRQSFLLSSIPCGVWMVYSTEILGLFHRITRLGLSLAWLLAALLAAIALLLVAPSKAPAELSEASRASQEVPEPAIGLCDRIALVLAAALAAIVGLTALVSPPNTWDAMEYHMPRVVEWAGNRSVHFYPTVDRQQLSMPPFSEYAMLHTYVLSGSDRFVNLVEWLGYLGSILAISLIAAELGGGRRTQAFAVALAVTVPTALLAASGAKNDNVLTFWIAVTVYLLLAWKHNHGWLLALSLAAAASLAVFSKGTAFVFLPPLVLACFLIWTPAARRRFLLCLPIFAVILFSVLGPLWVRNYQMTGSPLGLPYFDGAGPNQTRLFRNSPLGPAQAIAGILRNASINLSVPSQRVNDASTRLFSSMMRFIGVDPNDPGQIFRAQSGRFHPFVVHFAYRNEIIGGNQWDFLLFFAACLLYLRHRKVIGSAAGWFALGTIGAFVLFSVLLRWGPWNGKYQMPVFTLATAFIALVLDRALRPLTNRILAFTLILLCLPLATMNYMRPWLSSRGFSETLFKVPRRQLYFFDSHREIADSFIAAAYDPALRRCSQIGLDARLLRFEYPMMALVLRDNPEARFEYADVNNPTTQYADPSAPPPCVVICLGCAGSAEKLRLYGANPHAATYDSIVVFSNDGQPVIINQPPVSTPPLQ